MISASVMRGSLVESSTKFSAYRKIAWLLYSLFNKRQELADIMYLKN